jgi:superfamily I DNA/RNA helicase
MLVKTGCWNKMCIQVKHAASNTAQNISWIIIVRLFHSICSHILKGDLIIQDAETIKKLKQKWTHDIKDSIPKFFPNHLRRSATGCIASGARSHELLISCLVFRSKMSWSKFEIFFWVKN